jgi:hypothetical protein
VTISPTDPAPGAYVRDATGLYRIDHLKASNLKANAQVVLEDALSPMTSERVEDPDVPGRLGRSLVLQPRMRSLPVTMVCERFELVEQGPCAEDTASQAEYGRMGTAPT